MALEDLTNEEIDFLKQLDEKLRSEKIIEGNPYSTNPYSRKGFIDENFKDSQITKKELSRILKISKKNNIVFYPTMTQFGFSTAFGMTKVDPILNAPDLDPSTELLLRFKESQLPKEYNFQKLSEYFMEEGNLRTAEVAKIKITDNLVDYVY